MEADWAGLTAITYLPAGMFMHLSGLSGHISLEAVSSRVQPRRKWRPSLPPPRYPPYTPNPSHQAPKDVEGWITGLEEEFVSGLQLGDGERDEFASRVRLPSTVEAWEEGALVDENDEAVIRRNQALCGQWSRLMYCLSLISCLLVPFLRTWIAFAVEDVSEWTVMVSLIQFALNYWITGAAFYSISSQFSHTIHRCAEALFASTALCRIAGVQSGAKLHGRRWEIEVRLSTRSTLVMFLSITSSIVILVLFLNLSLLLSTNAGIMHPIPRSHTPLLASFLFCACFSTIAFLANFFFFLFIATISILTTSTFFHTATILLQSAQAPARDPEGAGVGREEGEVGGEGSGVGGRGEGVRHESPFENFRVMSKDAVAVGVLKGFVKLRDILDGLAKLVNLPLSLVLVFFTLATISTMAVATIEGDTTSLYYAAGATVGFLANALLPAYATDRIEASLPTFLSSSHSLTHFSPHASLIATITTTANYAGHFKFFQQPLRTKLLFRIASATFSLLLLLSSTFQGQRN